MGTPGQCLRNTLWQYASVSQNHIVRIPARCNPRSIPPIPENRLPTVSVDVIAILPTTTPPPPTRCRRSRRTLCTTPHNQAPRLAHRSPVCTARCLRYHLLVDSASSLTTFGASSVNGHSKPEIQLEHFTTTTVYPHIIVVSPTPLPHLLATPCEARYTNLKRHRREHRSPNTSSGRLHRL